MRLEELGRLVALFKVGQRDHMERLLNEGYCYLNTIEHFARHEQSAVRADVDEGLWFSHRATGARLDVLQEGAWQNIATLNGPIRQRDDQLSGTNIYCLHGRFASQFGAPFQLETLGFGDTYVLFRDADEFFRRFGAAVSLTGQTMRWGGVDYVDRHSYSGPMGAFRKFSEWHHQQEVRVTVQPGTGAPMELRLGDLSDIAQIGQASDVLKLDPKVPPNQPLQLTAAGAILRRRG